MHPMASTERVLAALSYQKPDHVPLFDTYWPDFVAAWRREKGLGPEACIESYYGVDISICAPDETPWPSRAAVLEACGASRLARDGWGAVRRTKPHGFFFEEVAVALPERRDPETLHFESPYLETRYEGFLASVARARAAGRCPFAKTGGPYLRTMNLRGSEEWLVDLAADPGYAAALAGKVTEHLVTVGCQAIRRGGLASTGIWIYDDIASNRGPMVSPRTYERIFLPLMARMVQAYRAAGARFVVMHSDGHILPVLDMLVDVGIDAIHPVEPKAGMDITVLRERYCGRLALVGGLDNALILPSGDRDRIREHVTRCVAAAREGGVVLGAHSIGPDIRVSDYDAVIACLRGKDL